jgi:hypothetical protein
MQERLVRWYRARGGEIDMPLYANLPSPYRLDAELPDSERILDAIAEFVAQHG